MKKVWLLYYRKYVEKNRYFINEIISEGHNCGLDIELITVEDVYDTVNERLFFDIKKPDAVISRIINPKLADYFEELGIRVFNRASVSRLCNNKAETIRRINAKNIIHIPTIAISLNKNGKYIYERIENAAFPEYNNALGMLTDSYLDSILQYENIESIDLAKYIIKSVTGHGGAEVMLLSDYCNNHAKLGVQEKDASDYYADKYIIQPVMAGYTSDIRVYLTGNEIIGAVKRTANGGFKSNYSLGGSIDLYEPDGCILDLVKKIITIDEFAYIGIDFLFAEGKMPVFNEIEDVVGAKMLSGCGVNGYVRKYIEYISYNIL